jgi:sigma-E factor negative regulatory protein RseA
MEQNRVIKVSMLLDDELNEEEALSLLEQIESDDGLKEKWFRYNTASLAIKSDSIVVLEADLVDKVRQAIAREPAVFSTPASTGKPSRIYNVFAGALAASVVIVAVIVVKQPADTGGDAATMVADKGVESLLHQAQPAEAKSSEARFHGYLLNHNESAYSMGTLGMLPYARVVSYGAKQQ